MAISGLVITLTDDPTLRARAMTAIEGEDRITVGERKKNRLPVVLETKSSQQGSHLVREKLMDLEGVEFVDVVTVDFRDEVLGAGR